MIVPAAALWYNILRMTAIKVDNVYYAYETNEGEESRFAVNGVSLEIEEGSFVAVAGHNGSGKSTLARLFNGLLLPDKGSVTVFGTDTKDEKNIYKKSEGKRS